MLVGITYDLREDYLEEGYSEEETAEFDRGDTIDGIEEALINSGFTTDRIGNARQLVNRLSHGDRWDIIFNIAEGMHGIGREALVPALLDAYQIPYTFSDPLVLALTLHKGMTKQIIRDLGLKTPDFTLVESIADVDKIDLQFPLFAKPVAEGTGKGINHLSKVETRQDLYTICSRLLNDFLQPVLVETYLPGREFTAGIVGTRDDAHCIGVMEVIYKEHRGSDPIYSYHNKAHYEELIAYRIPEDAVMESCAALALTAWKGLGCRDAGRIDIRMDAAAIPNFIEVNPLAGLNPVHSDLPIICSLVGISFQQLIEKIMDSTLKRTGLRSEYHGSIKNHRHHP